MADSAGTIPNKPGTASEKPGTPSSADASNLVEKQAILFTKEMEVCVCVWSVCGVCDIVGRSGRPSP